MASWEEDDNRRYMVLVNQEEQYSIWPEERENPLGWNEVGKSGTKQQCLDYIDEVWTDMRPLSLRKKMGEAVGKKKSAYAAAGEDSRAKSDTKGGIPSEKSPEDRPIPL